VAVRGLGAPSENLRSGHRQAQSGKKVEDSAAPILGFYEHFQIRYFFPATDIYFSRPDGLLSALPEILVRPERN